MVAVATAIYEKGTLRLLTPVILPERTRVRVQIVEEDKAEDDVQRALAVLEAVSYTHLWTRRAATCPACWATAAA